ncbi:hypothetical protein V3C99_009305 [Haemonchus contortus]
MCCSKVMFPTAETDFGLSMLRCVPSNVSLVVSPISVIFTLAMVHVGSKGSTRFEIERVISKGADTEGFNSVEGYYARLFNRIENRWGRGASSRIFNRFFLNKRADVEMEYEASMLSLYNAKIDRMDFGTANKTAWIIAGHICASTDGKICGMVKEENVKNMFSLVVNTNHFTGEWKFKFDKSSNSKGTFYSSEGKEREVEYMNGSNQEILHAEDDDVQVLSLPYLDTSYALNIFLPKNRSGLHEIRARLTGERVQSLLSKLKKTIISITIPKMKIEAGLNLEKALKDMSVSKSFSTKADFTGIINRRLLVAGAAHKAIIKVDEDGTTAAGATVFSKFESMSAIVGERVKFEANHPFLFILTKDNDPLFMGQFV